MRGVGTAHLVLVSGVVLGAYEGHITDTLDPNVPWDSSGLHDDEESLPSSITATDDDFVPTSSAFVEEQKQGGPQYLPASTQNFVNPDDQGPAGPQNFGNQQTDGAASVSPGGAAAGAPQLSPAQEEVLQSTVAANVPGELQVCWDLMQYLTLVEPEYSISPREFAGIGKEFCRLASLAKGARNERGAAAVLMDRQMQDEAETKKIADNVMTRLRNLEDRNKSGFAAAASLLGFLLLQ